MPTEYLAIPDHITPKLNILKQWYRLPSDKPTAGRLQLLCSHSFNFDLRCLRAIIRVGRLLEPWVLQGLLSGNPVGGIVDKDLLQEILEAFQERCVAGDDVLEIG